MIHLVERNIYINMLHELVKSGLITEKASMQLTRMLDDKKRVYKGKKHITDLVAMLGSIESIDKT